MCPNRNVFVSKSIQFWLTIILGILLPFYAVLGVLLKGTHFRRFEADFLPKGTRF